MYLVIIEYQDSCREQLDLHLNMHKILIQGTAQRPEVHIVTWKNDELTTDALPVHGYEHYKAKDYALAHAPFAGF